MPTIRDDIQAAILVALTKQRQQFNVVLAAKDDEIAILRARLATATTRLGTLVTPMKAPPSGIRGVARMAAGMKLPT